MLCLEVCVSCLGLCINIQLLVSLRETCYWFVLYFLCAICNSADGKYILAGGEDDLVQIWSMDDKKVVAWGEGHNSWVSYVDNDIQVSVICFLLLISLIIIIWMVLQVSGVAFDSYWSPPNTENSVETVMYRFGSVGQVLRKKQIFLSTPLLYWRNLSKWKSVCWIFLGPMCATVCCSLLTEWAFTGLVGYCRKIVPAALSKLCGGISNSLVKNDASGQHLYLVRGPISTRLWVKLL